MKSRAINVINLVWKICKNLQDRPFFDPKLISKLIKVHNDLEVDLVTTMFPRSYPPGLTGEVIKTDAPEKQCYRLTNQKIENT